MSQISLETFLLKGVSLLIRWDRRVLMDLLVETTLEIALTGFNDCELLSGLDIGGSMRCLLECLPGLIGELVGGLGPPITCMYCSSSLLSMEKFRSISVSF